MDPLSAVMARCSFVWLLAGFAAGALMMTDDVVAGAWRLWLQPSHVHTLVVGWFLQFALGVAYWLLPRKRAPERPLGYKASTAFAAVAALNLGLLIRALAEPIERSGHGGAWTDPVFAVSALFQLGAACIFVTQLWPRVAPRGAKSTAGQRSQPMAAGNPTDSRAGNQRSLSDRIEHTYEEETHVRHNVCTPTDGSGIGRLYRQ